MLTCIPCHLNKFHLNRRLHRNSQARFSGCSSLMPLPFRMYALSTNFYTPCHGAAINAIFIPRRRLLLSCESTMWCKLEESLHFIFFNPSFCRELFHSYVKHPQEQRSYLVLLTYILPSFQLPFNTVLISHKSSSFVYCLWKHWRSSSAFGRNI